MKNTAIEIIKILQSYGYQAVFAGGCVRDQLLGVNPKDYDIATNALPDEIEKIFDHTIPLGKSFGVITVLMNNYTFEVATFRKDGNYDDSRHPSFVEFCDMVEDANRRDFTINAMFYDPIADIFYDFFNGQVDLHNKLIRFVGNAVERIKEDRLRILRAIRFAIKYDFEFEYYTYMAVKAFPENILTVSIERIREELIKIFRCKNIRLAMDILIDTGLMQLILPEIYELRDCEQDKFWHPEGKVLEHTIRLLENIKSNSNYDNDDILIWAGLFHDVGKPATLFKDQNGRIRNHNHDNVGADITIDVLKRLKFSNDFIETVSDIVRDHMNVKRVEKMKKSTIKKYMHKPHIDRLLIVSQADNQASGLGYEQVNIKDYFASKVVEYGKSNVRPTKFIDGNDLISLGFKPSALFKEMIEKVYDLQLEDQLVNKEDAIKFVKGNWKVI